ncbi:unnamed protein product [Chrysodeixis includens]|uniref:ABC transporter domain-containing protein n=1 Tax=Chrysodeixis includens TaxID=689277 RepID=A0A9N8KTE8_CHRIL|nr:unnamed protein product [Chrysodeixis includens]
MNVPVLSKLTFDIYRGEFTMLLVDRSQELLMNTLDDLLTGIAVADRGTINVLGEYLMPGNTVMTTPYMMGYCHRSDTLIEDLTVQEHFVVFSKICLWHQKKRNIFQYVHIRSKRLLKDCDLESVRFERVRNLNIYYRAQLCWAMAVLLEPRVVVIPNFTDPPEYVAVIKDKIMRYKNYITIVALYYSSIQLEYADRVFVFDRKKLIFGGTPAYMFFRYGNVLYNTFLRAVATSAEAA